jgi:endonuclease/exonuclease/phosphatase family metal-dependent hydrolase
MFVLKRLNPPIMRRDRKPTDGNVMEVIKVMTFNIRCDMGQDGAHDWCHREHLVYDVITTERPHLIALQEVLPSQRRALEQNLPQFQWLGRGRQHGGAGEQCTIGLAAEVKLRDQGTFWLSQEPHQEASVGWDACLPRICTWVEAELMHSRFNFANVHYDHIGRMARTKSSWMMADLWSGRNMPTVIVGDFNSPPGSEPILELGRTFRDCYGSMMPESRVATYHEFGRLPDGPRIDYIFVSEEFEIESSNVLVEAGCASDHYPVVAQLRLSAAEGRL